MYVLYFFYFSLLLTLEEVTSKVILKEGEEYESTATTVSLAVIEVTNQSKMRLILNN